MNKLIKEHIPASNSPFWGSKTVVVLFMLMVYSICNLLMLSILTMLIDAVKFQLVLGLLEGVMGGIVGAGLYMCGKGD